MFHTNRDGNFELYVMNGDGSGVRRLTDYPGVDQFPDWSPDGQEVAVRRDTDVYVLDLRSMASRRVTDAHTQKKHFAAVWVVALVAAGVAAGVTAVFSWVAWPPWP